MTTSAMRWAKKKADPPRPADIPMLQKSPVQLNQPTAAAPDAASPSAAGEIGEIKVNAAQPLTENLKESGSGDGKLPLPKVSGTLD